MNIITSEYGGFCPGVKLADKKIRALLKEKQPNEKIYIIGPLIHNDIYNHELEALGANIISFNCIEKIIENEALMHTFVIRTHGVTKENFNEIKNQTNTVLIDFYADWCGPCRMVGPTVHEIAEERSDITVGKINVDNDPELAQQFGVMSIPTIVILKNGEEAARAVGVRTKQQLLDMIG